MKDCLLGAIMGDVCGKPYEFPISARTKNYNQINLYHPKARFSDDTICTIGIADAFIRNSNPSENEIGFYLQNWCIKYPHAGYGRSFRNWIADRKPYNSWGNGSAMRVSAVGYVAKSLEECEELATRTAIISHNHPEGIKGAVITAKAIWHARRHDYNAIEELLITNYPKYAELDLEEIRKNYEFYESCQDTVPVALKCFLDSGDFEDCITLAISMGGDSDTLAAIAGSIAWADCQDASEQLITFVKNRLPENIIKVIKDFDKIVQDV